MRVLMHRYLLGISCQSAPSCLRAIRVFFLGAVCLWPDAVQPNSLPALRSVQLRSPFGADGV